MIKNKKLAWILFLLINIVFNLWMFQTSPYLKSENITKTRAVIIEKEKIDHSGMVGYAYKYVFIDSISQKEYEGDTYNRVNFISGFNVNDTVDVVYVTKDPKLSRFNHVADLILSLIVYSFFFFGSSFIVLGFLIGKREEDTDT